MASYHLWQPAYVESNPLTLEAFVTLGDSIFLGTGTDAFVSASLAVAGVTAPVVRWELQVMRTHYFSSYRAMGAGWRDDWDLVWRLRATIAADPAPLLKPGTGGGSGGYADLDAVDASYRPDRSPSDWAAWPCLLLAVADEGPILDNCAKAVAAAAPAARCARVRLAGGPMQLRCDLGSRPLAFYEQGAIEAEALLRDFEAAGASVRHAVSGPIT